MDNIIGKLNIVAQIAMFPIYGCKFKIPLNFTQETNKYTEKGRHLPAGRRG